MLRERSREELHYEFALQFILSCVMINLIYFAFSSALFFKYGTISHIPSLLIFISTLIILIGVISKFYHEPCPFDYFRFSFKSTAIAMNHWHFYTIVIIIISILEVLVPTKYSWAPGIPCISLFLFTLIYRPYLKFIENLRSAFNLLMMSIFVGFRFFI